MSCWGSVIPRYVLLWLCHPRLITAGVLPSQTVCYWGYVITDCVLLGLCYPRLNAAGVKPSETLSYQGFVIPELCATEAMPPQTVSLDDLLVVQYPQLSCPGTDVLDDSIYSYMFSHTLQQVGSGVIERVPIKLSSSGKIQCYCAIYLQKIQQYWTINI